MIVCYGFGLEPSADFPVSASMTCGLLAQAIGLLPGGHTVGDLSLFADGTCSGADLASSPDEPAKYIGIACSWASDILGALVRPAAVLASLGCTLAPSVGHSLGAIFESKHELDVAGDVMQRGYCIKYSPTHFGSPWLAIKCALRDPGFSDLQLAGTSGDGSGSGGGAGGSGSGGSGGGTGGGSGGGAGPGTDGTGAQQIAAGDYHTCALLGAGTVDCWGLNSDGQLGNGTTSESHIPAAVSGIAPATMVSVNGNYDSCAVLVSGIVDCWGANPAGNLGDGTSAGPQICATDGLGGLPCSTNPVPVNGITNAVSVSAGTNHACALLKNGGIDCWGESAFGELGNGTTIGADSCGATEDCMTSPVPVSGITNAATISSGESESCAVLATGTVECWGSNSNGQLGDGTNTGPEDCSPAGYCSAAPVMVEGITNATSVSVADGFYSCAVLVSGGVDCWGDNSFGQLGDGGTTSSDVPVPVTGITNATAVSTNYDHACALLATGGVDCWGGARYGDLGSNGGSSNVPVPVTGITNATAVSAGGAYSCAALATRGIECWGTNNYGQLGNGTTTWSDVPVPVSGIG